MRKRKRVLGAGNLSELATRALVLLSQRRLSAASLADVLGVSTITAKRLVAALRAGGYRVSSVRARGRAWFVVDHASFLRNSERDPFLTTVVRRGAMVASAEKLEDADYDQD